MDSRSDFCPGCGAQVYPEEAHCPFCGRNLKSRAWVPFAVGFGGAGAALLVGGLAWWVLDALPPTVPPRDSGQQVAAQTAPADAAPPAAPQATPEGAAPAAAPSAPAFAPPPDAPAGASQALITPQPFGSIQPPPAATPGGALALAAPGPADGGVGEARLPLPTLHSPPPVTPADVETRKAFAKQTQQKFVENGLDLTVATSGDDAAVLTIKFNFPAQTAAELIVSGPFPRQCAQRGFRQVVFLDPSGATWLYDVATQQMSQK
ncbi:zinc ribbon domain-containing protein [Xanthobacter tagetidis]|jgi:hypothetical protein|uniref:Zinc ribbon domain-containing protein n=1 Tax=Xanthobacter tagetidis TaxID=60216 RepID=A0A3L7AC02_9HYPH|nr:zinc ribbon domain-containing protein [Xanthobacter tagetidis]MBB6309632.1 hypothetical protein [Xanthobacter tagetidis]RLP77181.1 zinc ribbon domain-containing protein [Xanthobacter tagetidis]